jgi:BMFP domain-containing protein YqiC
MRPSEFSYSTTASPGYPNINKAQENDLKSNLIKMIETFKGEMNKSLKEIWENATKQVEAFKEETDKSLKEIQENTIKQLKEINKTVQDLKMDIEVIKKIQSKGILEVEKLGKRTRTTNASITNRIQELEERISGMRETIEEIDTSIKENVKSKKFLT